MIHSLLCRGHINSSNVLSQRFFKSQASFITSPLEGFTFWPNFFSISEQRILLSTALDKLDAMEPRRNRRRRESLRNLLCPESPSLQSIFFSDEMYDFQEGHYDGVIRHYREMHLASWLEEEVTGLPMILQRLQSLCPTQTNQTHLLHLASRGEILPHIDNVLTSGSWILGVSLGDQRTLRMEDASAGGKTFDFLLPSGSVYLQRDDVRFGFKHSITKACPQDQSDNCQRLSIMIRDCLPLRVL